MNYKVLVALCFAALISGCNQTPAPMAGPVKVAGKVLKADGSPLGNVAISFQPIETGHPGSMTVNAAGEFSGELVPGKFVYFIEPQKKAPGNDALKSVSKEYLEPNMTHVAVIAADQPVEIRLQ